MKLLERLLMTVDLVVRTNHLHIVDVVDDENDSRLNVNETKKKEIFSEIMILDDQFVCSTLKEEKRSIDHLYNQKRKFTGCL